MSSTEPKTTAEQRDGFSASRGLVICPMLERPMESQFRYVHPVRASLYRYRVSPPKHLTKEVYCDESIR